MNGTCRLCKSFTTLKESHFMPKFGYKAVLQSEATAPVLTAAGISVRRIYQIKDYLLCGACEEIFNKSENYVSKLIHRPNENSFPLLESLDRLVPAVSGDYGEAYNGNQLPALEIDKIARFALSVIWRGSAHVWTNYTGIKFLPCSLGTYEAKVAAYLLNQVELPPEISVMVFAIKNMGGIAMFSPTRLKMNGNIAHKFEIAGLKFVVTAGKRLINNPDPMCIVRGMNNPVLVLDQIKTPLDEGVLAAIGSSRKAKNI